MTVTIFIIALAVSLDAAAAGFALGCGRIKLPHISAAATALVSAAFLCIPALLGELMTAHVNAALCRTIARLMIAFLGIFSLCRYFLRRKHKPEHIPLKVCIDESEAGCADINRDRRLSLAEALILSAGLSADSAVTGLSAGMSGISGSGVLSLFICSSVIGIAAVEAGWHIGRRTAEKLNISAGWLSGVILIITALFI